MLIDKNGKEKNINSFLNLRTGNIVLHKDNQFFQETKTGKRLELWENLKDGSCLRVTYWNMKNVGNYLYI